MHSDMPDSSASMIWCSFSSLWSLVPFLWGLSLRGQMLWRSTVFLTLPWCGSTESLASHHVRGSSALWRKGSSRKNLTLQSSISRHISSFSVSCCSFIKEVPHRRSLWSLWTRPCSDFLLIALSWRSWQHLAASAAAVFLYASSTCLWSLPANFLKLGSIAVEGSGFGKHSVVLHTQKCYVHGWTKSSDLFIYFIHCHTPLVVGCYTLQTIGERKHFGSFDIAEKDKSVNVKIGLCLLCDLMLFLQLMNNLSVIKSILCA